MSNNFFEKLFQVMAVICVIVAIVFLWFENYDGLFVAAALGCVGYFLSFRFQVKERLDKREAERLRSESLPESYPGLFNEDNNAAVDISQLEINNSDGKIEVDK